MRSEQEAFDALCAYTLARGNAEFIHQLAVDAYKAQHADEGTKPIALTFALITLYLAVEKGWSGKRVQRAHMKLARRKRTWPQFKLPEERGSMTVFDVLEWPAGERDRAIHRWCAAVWAEFADTRPAVVGLLAEFGIV